MKNLAIAAVVLGMSITVQAQNTNVIKASTTTTTTVNDGSAPKQTVKTQNTEAVNQIELKDGESKQLNKEVMETPYQVNSTTSVSTDPGFNAKVGQITTYTMGGKEVLFISDKAGYNIKTQDNKDLGKLRRISNNNYIFKSKKTTSVGRFDGSGNFVVETYDDKTDGVTVETYTKKQ